MWNTKKYICCIYWIWVEVFEINFFSSSSNPGYKCLQNLGLLHSSVKCSFLLFSVFFSAVFYLCFKQRLFFFQAFLKQHMLHQIFLCSESVFDVHYAFEFSYCSTWIQKWTTVRKRSSFAKTQKLLHPFQKAKGFCLEQTWRRRSKNRRAAAAESRRIILEIFAEQALTIWPQRCQLTENGRTLTVRVSGTGVCVSVRPHQGKNRGSVTAEEAPASDASRLDLKRKKLQ